LEEVSVAPLLEIVDLANGDIVLQQEGGEGGPMVTIRFSGDANAMMPLMRLEVAKAMIQAGLQAFAELSEQADRAVLAETEIAAEDRVVH
jgi:hypothetical protein